MAVAGVDDMKCTKARELLSDGHNGELDSRAAAELERHLGGCAACREAAAQLDETMALLGAMPPPALPGGFGVAMHERLIAEGQRLPTEAAPEPASHRPGWAVLLGGAGLVAAGAAAVLLVWWATSVPRPVAPACPAPGHAARPPDRASAAGVATRPQGETRRLRVGQVAVLVLSIRAEAGHADARLQVVLPDGVVLLGEGARALEEKRMEWTASLVRGENEIRIPVRAQRVGTWRLVARARAAGLRTASEARLVVTRS
jgi:anti-sigma factor RsiW